MTPSLVKADANNVGFTIEAKQPEHQINKSLGYFNVEAIPGSKQILNFDIINWTNKPANYNIQVNPATTNSNGLIVYTPPKEKLAPLMTMPLTKLAQLPAKKVTVAGNSRKTVSIDVTIPKEGVKGIVLGGVNVFLDEKQKKTSGITNTYSYTLGIVLAQNRQTKMYGNEKIVLKSVKPILFDGAKVVEARILNPNPEIFGPLKIKGKIYKQGSNKVLFSQQLTDAKIAPQTVLPFHIDWGKQDLKPGKYVFEADAKSGKKKWHFKQSFTIAKPVANKLNQQTVFKLHYPKGWFISFYGLVIASVVTCLIIISKERKKEND